MKELVSERQPFLPSQLSATLTIATMLRTIQDSSTI